MSVNSFSFSSSNDSHLHPPKLPYSMDCLINRPGSVIFTSFIFTNLFVLLPLCIYILYLGLQRRRQQHSASNPTMSSHSDVFTYHMVVMELFGILGCIIFFCGTVWSHENALMLGFSLYSFVFNGELLFHLLTCVERYLAVVHPITYRSLRGERGIRARNITIGCVWMFCCGATCLMRLDNIIHLILDISLSTSSLISISFCSLSTLRVLIHPGPGDRGGDRERVDQSKQRAFYTIMAILGALFMRCFWDLTVVAHSCVSGGDDLCAMIALELWINIPSSLVLPLLFLHRVGTLACCKRNTEGG